MWSIRFPGSAKMKTEVFKRSGPFCISRFSKLSPSTWNCMWFIMCDTDFHGCCIVVRLPTSSIALWFQLKWSYTSRRSTLTVKRTSWTHFQNLLFQSSVDMLDVPLIVNCKSSSLQAPIKISDVLSSILEKKKNKKGKQIILLICFQPSTTSVEPFGNWLLPNRFTSIEMTKDSPICFLYWSTGNLVAPASFFPIFLAPSDKT